MSTIQTMLSALGPDGRLTIGIEPTHELRRLSDSRKLWCPLCKARVVLRAGPVVAAHFAHLPGAVCAHPHAEPETDEHRAGKALLLRWAAACLPDAKSVAEAVIPETGQRADLLITMTAGRRVAIEYQCAELAGREWRRRRGLYAQASVQDLWILGGSRLRWDGAVLQPSDLERAMLVSGTPLLFLDSAGEALSVGELARFRAQRLQSRNVPGSLIVRPLLDLPFPWNLLKTTTPEEDAAAARAAAEQERILAAKRQAEEEIIAAEDARLLRILRIRYRCGELPPLFGFHVFGGEAFACSPHVWQACVYYRWIHERVGQEWWIEEVNTWARARLPLAIPTGRLVRRALEEFQELLSASGLLSMPQGKGRARVRADLLTLGFVPDITNVRRIASYRRTLSRE